MKPEPETQGLRDSSAQTDEIEILEIVGMREDDEAAPVERDEEEVVVTFDEPPAAAPPLEPPKAESDDTRERMLRLRAEFENLKKRVERERDEYHRHATAALVARLLPVVDSFERALAAAPDRSEDDPLRQGLCLVHRQLIEELRREGLRPIESLGQTFDPAVHEAAATDSSAGLPPNLVVEELRRGYHFEDRLLRPALVRVSVGPPAEGDPPLDAEES